MIQKKRMKGIQNIGIILLLMIVSCAKRGYIDGGEKDITPPKLLYSMPKNESTHFDGNTIKLTFDEYVKLKGVDKQLIVSPPLSKMPFITPSVASKTITVKITDTLRPNTTYSFNFGSSIQDNNEGNVLEQFRYVFSTGSYIDSLYLRGRVVDALDMKPVSFASIMLYEINDKFTDSIIYKEKPRYVTNTLDSITIFNLENLKEGKYFLMALKDKNNNLKFDVKQDKVGFYSDTITLPTTELYMLKLFQEIPDFKSIRAYQASQNRIILGYEGNPEDVQVILKNGDDILNTIITPIQNKDSIQIWFPSLMVDSLALKIVKEDYKKDFSVKMKKQKKDSLVLKTEQNVLHLKDLFVINSTIPLVRFDESKMDFINKDSTKVSFRMVYDTLSQQLFYHFDKEPLEKYSLTLFPGAITDYLEMTNDTLQFHFTTKNTSDYGNLKLILNHVKTFPIIIELTNAKGAVLASAYSEEETIIDFINILPELYTVRIIYDDNKNKKWDTGNYLRKQQPEQVIYFSKQIDVRANWDVEQLIELPPD